MSLPSSGRAIRGQDCDGGFGGTHRHLEESVRREVRRTQSKYALTPDSLTTLKHFVAGDIITPHPNALPATRSLG